MSRNIRQLCRASARAMRRPNARLSLSLAMWREAKAWLELPGPKPMCRHGAMIERANFSALNPDMKDER